MKNTKYIIAVLSAVVISASFTGCSDTKDDSSESSSNIIYYNDSNSYTDPQQDAIDEANARANAVTVPGKINESASVGECVINARRAVSLGERRISAASDDMCEIITVELEVTNNTQETMHVSSLGDFSVSIDGANPIAGLDISACTVAAKTVDGFETFDFDIEPGNSASGYIAFSAASGWSNIEIKYTPLEDQGNYDSVVYTVTPDMVER
ncbi:MAG: DUF4352 domain-containing protein [Porcipelethomonas sp.]